MLDYSTGGIYGALDNSGYFERTLDKIRLTEKGEEYLNKKILPHYDILRPIGNIIIIMSSVFILQWINWTYFQRATIMPWHCGLILLILGFVLRFLGLRLNYLIINKKKKDDISIIHNRYLAIYIQTLLSTKFLSTNITSTIFLERLRRSYSL